MTVWGDGVFLLNAILDYLLLAGAAKLRGGGAEQGRLLCAAGFGGALAVMALYRQIPPLLRLAAMPAMAAVAFGVGKEGLRRCLVFGGLSLTLFGAMTALSGAAARPLGIPLHSWQGLAAAAGLLYAGCAALRGAAAGKRLLRTQVTAGGRTLSFRCLEDTGNLLRDPLTGRAVVVADSTVASRLLSLGTEQLRDPMTALPKLAAERPELQARLIPFSAVGTEKGLLLAVRCRELLIGGTRRTDGILAFTAGELSSDGSYHGLTGGEL